jgi:hypothetical protein
MLSRMLDIGEALDIGDIRLSIMDRDLKCNTVKVLVRSNSSEPIQCNYGRATFYLANATPIDLPQAAWINMAGSSFKMFVRDTEFNPLHGHRVKVLVDAKADVEVLQC